MVALTHRNRRLTEAEQRVCKAAESGAVVDLQGTSSTADNPAQGETWDAARVVRAELLFQILTRSGSSDAGPARPLRLRGARITGPLDLGAASLVRPLTLQDCYFQEAISLQEATAPAIRLPGCRIPGLAADQLETRGNLELNKGFVAQGQVSLVGAQIGGLLDCSNATLTGSNNVHQPALNARGLTVDQDVFFTSGFTAAGEVCLAGAHIRGQLDCSGAKMTNPGGRALNAGGLTVDQGMFCTRGFAAEGEVRVLGAHIGGPLECSGARLINDDGPALNAGRLRVGQGMFCRDQFTAHGEVRLPGAQIGAQLALEGATFDNPNGVAVNAGRLRVDQDMWCTDGFTARGHVRLAGAEVGGELNLEGSSFANPDGVALDLERLSAVALLLLPRRPPDGLVDLVNAQVRSFSDSQATWPAQLRLRGFVYESLENDRGGVRSRLDWLKRDQGGYAPQLYEQLAAAYRRAGRDEAARQVAIAKQWRRRRGLNPLGRLWNWLLYLLVGYGYRTWLAGVWLAVLLVVGTRVFTDAYPDQMIPAKQPTPVFHPIIYTLDRLLPIVNLGQRDSWIPQGTALRWSWLLTVAGWVLTTAVVAGLTRILQRD